MNNERQTEGEPGVVAQEQKIAPSLAAFIRRRKRWMAGISVAIVLYAVLGFFVAPWAIKKLAIDAVSSNLQAQLRIDKVSLNPFVMSLGIQGLELDLASGEPLARAQRIYLNFQTSSLFRWAWSFAEMRFDGPELFLSRDSSGVLNLSTLMASTDQTDSPAEPRESSGMPRLYISSFSINNARVDWRDEVPPEPVTTIIGPVSVQVTDLNTLPERSGEQEVVITTETQGTLSWAGSLQLNPPASAGHASIHGSHFPIVSAYIRHETGLDIVHGVAGIELDYAVSAGGDGVPRVSVDKLDIALNDLQVNTFHGNPDDEGRARRVFRVAEIALGGGSLRWPEREVEVAEFRIDEPALELLRLDTGEFDFAQGPVSPQTPEQPAGSDTGEGQADWQFALQRFVVNNFAVGLVDQSVDPVADVGADHINLEVLEISNAPGAVFPTAFSMSAREGGEIRMQGTLAALPEFAADLEVRIQGLVLAAAHPYIKPLLDVSLDSGALNLSGRLRHDGGEPLAFEADAEIADFLITETDAGTRLGSWDHMFVDGLSLHVSEGTLEISEVRFVKPYGDILIASDGSVNLGRVAKSSQPQGEGDVAPAEAADPEAANQARFSTTIGRVLIEDASAHFADESLPLPFATKIRNLDGTLSTIATDSAEPSMVKLEGAVDDYGQVRVTGSITPLDVPKNTDLSVVFQNVEMPKFSAYTIPFAGREIAGGKLDLDLGYQVRDSQLVGENRIVLRDFELGKEVPHEGAANLPLGLAVALLKDSEGKIDIDLPVRGNLDDPEFGYGRVILGALRNLIVKIVASPFALLGTLVGAEPDKLEYINFPPGRADLGPPELERVQKLASALALRPELILEISGVIDREVDALALKAQRIDDLIEARIKAQPPQGDTDKGYAALRLKTLEALYAEVPGGDPALLDGLRAQYTSMQRDAQTGKEAEQFDALAYSGELRRRLIDNQVIDEATLQQLAQSRALNTRDATLAVDQTLQGRIAVGESRVQPSGEADDVVRMKVSLAVGERPESSEPKAGSAGPT
jgi:hypothetical protein